MACWVVSATEGTLVETAAGACDDTDSMPLLLGVGEHTSTFVASAAVGKEY